MEISVLIQYIVFALTIIALIAVSVFCMKFQRGKDEYLCGDCRFNNEQDCQKEIRPKAIVCTSYREAKGSDIKV